MSLNLFYIQLHALFVKVVQRYVSQLKDAHPKHVFVKSLASKVIACGREFVAW